ncbi:MAG TPA: GNAT family N-acetyltransferase [Legionella sp.]|nr:GNAT family N-acetyltransferase [Legionella sp.]
MAIDEIAIKIDYLKNHPHKINDLAQIWLDELGKVWCPEVELAQVRSKFEVHLNSEYLPISKVAFINDKIVGMCCLRVNDGVREDLTPWLGGLVITKSYQGQGLGKMLIESMKADVKRLGFSSLYLLTFDPTLPNYYRRLGWEEIEKNTLLGKPVTIMNAIL